MTNKKLVILLLILTALPHPLAAQDEVRVLGVSATAGGPATFTLVRKPSERQSVRTTSPLITRALALAHISFAAVKLDLVSDSVVKRVNPFAIGHGGPGYPGEYRLSRIATQRKPDGSDEHLEVFVLKGQDPTEKAYNVYDACIIEVLMAIASGSNGPRGASFDLVLDTDNGPIVEITLGEKRR